MKERNDNDWHTIRIKYGTLKEFRRLKFETEHTLGREIGVDEFMRYLLEKAFSKK